MIYANGSVCRLGLVGKQPIKLALGVMDLDFGLKLLCCTGASHSSDLFVLIFFLYGSYLILRQ